MIEGLDTNKETTEAEIKSSIKQIDQALKAREDPNNERPAKLKKIEKLREKLSLKRQKLNVFMKCDDAKVQEMKNFIYISREACNRWCDNIYILKEWMLAARPDLTFKELSANFPALKCMFMVT
jgi:chromosome segregation ATPase